MTLPKTRNTTGNIFAITSLAVMLAIAAHAQDVVTIDPALAQKHLTHKVEAKYPADALADQVQGTVGLRLSIDTTGHVTDAEVTSGPEALRQAAIDAVRQWVYQPFAIGGKPLAAAADVRVSFTLPPTSATAPPAAPPAAAPAAAVIAPPPAAVAAAPPPESKPTFESAAGPAEATDAQRPAAETKSTFDSAAGAAQASPETMPAVATKPAFESASGPSDPPPPTTRPSPSTQAAASSSAFESATPPAETPAMTEPTPAAASAAPPPASPKPAFEAAAPVEAAPAAIPPAAEANALTQPAAPGDAASATPATDSFAPLSDQCHKLMAAHGEVDQLVSVCGEMAAAAENFPPDSHYIERRAAYVFDAAALLRAWKYPEAEAMAKRAVGVVEEGHDDVTGASAAYAVLGNAQALNGKLAEADKSLDTAEALERKALDAAAGHPSQATYSTTLRTILLFHAETLDRMGNKQAATAKRAEAALLLPVPNN